MKIQLFQVGVEPSDIHVIGFSLGAQVVGCLGYAMGGALPRVTGLDPAGLSNVLQA